MVKQMLRTRVGYYSTAGFQFIIPFGMMTAAGILLDRWLNTKVGFTILGGMIGFGIGLWRLRQIARSMSGDVAADIRDDSAPGDEGGTRT